MLLPCCPGNVKVYVIQQYVLITCPGIAPSLMHEIGSPNKAKEFFHCLVFIFKFPIVFNEPIKLFAVTIMQQTNKIALVIL